MPMFVVIFRRNLHLKQRLMNRDILEILLMTLLKLSGRLQHCDKVIVKYCFYHEINN